jgi:3-oxoadipyl-CoA thiolase
VDEVFFGCANQAGEDNRNVARMALLLAGLPESIPGVTLNRLCASGMDAIGTAFRAIASGEMELAIAGGVESMSRAPFVMGKAESGYSRNMKLEDTTIGWRFINPLMKSQYGVDPCRRPPTTWPTTIRFRAPTRTLSPCAASRRRPPPRPPVSSPKKSCRCALPTRKAKPSSSVTSTCARTPPWKPGQAQAGQWPGQDRHRRQRLGRERRCGGADPGVGRSGEETRPDPRARVLGMASAGVAPRVMGIGPVPAVRKLTERLGVAVSDFDVIELNEAFASQGLAVLRELGVADDAPQVNPNGGAIALGHPLGMSGARLVLTALHQLEKSGGRKGLATMCVGVGQGWRWPSSGFDLYRPLRGQALHRDAITCGSGLA